MNNKNIKKELKENKALLEVFVEKNLYNEEQTKDVLVFIEQINKILDIIEDDSIKIKKKLLVEIENIINQFKLIKMKINLA